MSYLTEITLPTSYVEAKDLMTRINTHKNFVVPCHDIDLIEKIKSRFPHSAIYMPRCIIEARGCLRVSLPVKKLSVSMTMHNCRIWLFKTCRLKSIEQKIAEMCGSIVSFDDANVVVVDRPDDKHVVNAFKRGIPVVGTQWIEDSYRIAHEEDRLRFNHDAMSTTKDYQIKPFFQLHFKFCIRNPEPRLKQMLIENGASILYGNENCLTHVVVTEQEYENFVASRSKLAKQKKQNDGPQPVKKVSVDFLVQCVNLGHYITREEYLMQKSNTIDPNVIVKQELPTQTAENQITQLRAVDNVASDTYRHNPMQQVNHRTTATITSPSMASPNSESHAKLLPPPLPRSASTRQRQQQQQQTSPQTPSPPEEMSEMILNALSAFETAQTQMASTQMRRLPDSELKIEQLYEPSQQLFWNENVRKH